MTSPETTPAVQGKKKNLLIRRLRVVDLVFEVVDARCPVSSRSPLVRQLIKHKQQILILNKADLADPQATARWLDYFAAAGITAVAVDSRQGSGFRELWGHLAGYEIELKKRLEEKGRLARELRTAVVGIPNTGKSSFLNRLVGRRTAATGDRPGITKGPQWVHVKGRISVLDTPGVLPPQIREGDVFKLISIGAVDYIEYEPERVGEQIINFLEENYPENITKYLGTSREGPLTLEILARHKNFILPEGMPDLHRTAGYLIKLFKHGKLGRVTFELPA